MNKLIAFFLVGISLISYTSCSEKGYKVNVSFAQPQDDNQMVYLFDGNKAVDSAAIVNNQLSFQGQTDSVIIYQLVTRQRGRLRPITRLLLQQDSKIEVSIDKEVVVDDNGGVNSLYNSFNRDLKAETNKNVAKYQQMIKDKVSEEKIMEFANSFTNKRKNKWVEAVNKNSDNLVGAAILADNCMGLDDPKEFKDFLGKVKYASLFPDIQVQKEFLHHQELTAEGKKFVDFPGKTIDGKPIKLSDYVGKGKYVLVDFWASWCGPCRGEIPNLIAVNKKFAGDKFMVLGINVWDTDKAFKKAMEEEKINYDQIYASDNQDATTLYGINGIPQIILFGPDGTIVKRNLRGDAIAAKVQEVLTQK